MLPFNFSIKSFRNAYRGKLLLHKRGTEVMNVGFLFHYDADGIGAPKNIWFLNLHSPQVKENHNTFKSIDPRHVNNIIQNAIIEFNEFELRFDMPTSMRHGEAQNAKFGHLFFIEDRVFLKIEHNNAAVYYDLRDSEIRENIEIAQQKGYIVENWEMIVMPQDRVISTPLVIASSIGE